MPFDPNAPFEVLEPQTKEASGFDPSQPFEVIETPSGFDPSQPFEVDASTVGNPKVVADGIADALSTALNLTSGIPKPLTNILLRSGGKKTDIALNTLLPMAGGAVGTVAAPGVGTVAGGAAGGFAGESITELRQILRGERENFSPGSLIGTTAVSAFVPAPIKAVGGSLAKTAGKTVLTRGAQGVGLGGIQEAVREAIDLGELSLEDISKNALWGGIFGGAFGALEGAAPALFKAIRGKPPKEAVAVLREEGTPPALLVADEIDAKLASGEVELPPPPAPEPGPEMKRLLEAPDGAQKLSDVQAGLADPDVTIQYQVWPRESLAPGIESRVVQIDLPSPNAPKTHPDGSWASPNIKLLRELGQDLPEPPESLAPGAYTLDEIKAAIAKEAPVAATPEVGLGAASPKEFQPVDEFVTSIKNRTVDSEMRARGETPLMSEAAKDFGTTWDDAMKRIDENQNVADDLIAELQTKIRPATNVENAILLHRKIELENTFNKAAKNIRENTGTPDSLAADRIAKQQALDDLLALNKISRATGSEQSAALNTRKLMAAQDYSLTSMIEKVSTAKGDVKLTPDEIRATEAAHQKIVDAQKALDESAPDQININQAKLDQAKAEFDETLGRFRYEQLSTTRKFLANAADTWDLIRNIYSSGEFSAVLRQGLIPLASRPLTSAKAIPKAAKAFLSDEVMARKIDLDTLNSPEAAIAREAGVQLDEPGQKLGQREESIASEWAKKIWGIRNFNQFSRVFLNKVRVDNFNAMKNVRPDLTPDDLKLIAKYVNQATGRGSLGRFEKNAAELNRVLFSARFQASRLQYLTGNSAWGGNGRTRAIIGREYARTLLGLAAMYSLYELGFSGEEGYQPVSFEPRETDFGKLHFGPATIDPLAGLSQWIVFGTRTGLTLADSFGVDTGGQSINSKGELVSLREPKFNQDDYGDVAERFGRSKLHPLVGAVWSAHTGMDIMRQPTSWLQEAEKFKMPMTYEDILQAFQTMDVDQATAVSALAMLGMGLNVQQEKAEKQMGVARPEADAKKESNVRPAK